MIITKSLVEKEINNFEGNLPMSYLEVLKDEHYEIYYNKYLYEYFKYIGFPVRLIYLGNCNLINMSCLEILTNDGVILSDFNYNSRYDFINRYIRLYDKIPDLYIDMVKEKDFSFTNSLSIYVQEVMDNYCVCLGDNCLESVKFVELGDVVNKHNSKFMKCIISHLIYRKTGLFYGERYIV